MNKFFTFILLVFWLLAADSDWVVGQEMVLVGDANVSVSPWEQVDDKWFFVSHADLWVTDGTELGAEKLLEDDFFFFVDTREMYMGGYQGMLYFAAEDEDHGVEVWRSDGTKEGTQFFADLAEGTEDSHPSGFVEYEGYLYIWTYLDEDGQNLSQLWRTDGTNIEMVKEIPLCEDGSTHAYALQEYTITEDAIFFALGTGDFGGRSCLWKTDGTAEGTDIAKELEGREPENLMTLNDFCYFTSFHQEGFTATDFLWRIDGTSGVTSILEDTEGIGAINGLEEKIEVVGDKIYFVVEYTFPPISELRVTEDTQTQLLEEFTGFRITNLTGFDDKLFFVFADEDNGMELWTSDGSENSMNLFEDINAGTGDGNPRYLTVIGGNLYFIANYSDENYGLYRVVGETVEQLIDFETTDIVDTRGLFPFGEDKILLLNKNSENVNQLWLYSPLIDNIEENLDFGQKKSA